MKVKLYKRSQHAFTVVEVLISTLALAFLLIVSLQFFKYIQHSQAVIEQQERLNDDLRTIGSKLKEVLVNADVFFIEKSDLPPSIKSSPFYNQFILPEPKANKTGNILFFAASELSDIGQLSRRHGDNTWDNSGRYKQVTIHVIYPRPTQLSKRDPLNPSALELVWYRNSNFYTNASTNQIFLWDNGAPPGSKGNNTTATNALSAFLTTTANLSNWTMGAFVDQSPPDLSNGGVEVVINRNLGSNPKASVPSINGMTTFIDGGLIRTDITLSNYSAPAKHLIKVNKTFDVFSRHDVQALE